MSSLREIEAAVRRLSAEEVASFAVWFDRFRSKRTATDAPGSLASRLKKAPRAERRVLAERAAEESAEYYRRQPEEVLPDILDEPT